MADLAALVDRLANRLGTGRLYRLAPAESDVPERAVRRLDPLAPAGGATWPVALPRPMRMFRIPQSVEAIVALPGHPPAVFIWRRSAPPPPHRGRSRSRSHRRCVYSPAPRKISRFALNFKILQ
jgi:hypothetical protein